MSDTPDRDELTRLAFAAAEGHTRLSPAEAVSLLESADVLALGTAASAMRARLVPDDEVTFIVDRNVNYTNVCVSECRFCAFYATREAENAYVLTRQELAEKVRETVELEGTAIRLQGGMHPDLTVEWDERMLAAI